MRSLPLASNATPAHMKWIALTFSLALLQPLSAIIVFDEPGRQLEPPADAKMREGWNLHGAWQGATGVLVGRDWFLTVAHVGTHVGSFFDWNGHAYHTTEVVAVPHSDLLLYRVDETFPAWIELWDADCGREISHSALLLGRGCARGLPIQMKNLPSPGWLWGESDGRLSWGTCDVKEIFQAGADLGELLVWTWDRSGGPTTGTLSAGDSGGGLLLQDPQGTWRLAGLHFDVDPAVDGADTQYSFTEAGDPFWAAIHDGRGLWRGVLGMSFKAIDADAPAPLSMWAGATRIAPHADFIRSVIAPGSRVGEGFRPAFHWSARKIAILLAGLVGLGGLLLCIRWHRTARKDRHA